MRTSDAGIKLIQQFEGIRLTAYQCAAGVWTIGWGHTAGVKRGDTITKAKALEYLKSDLQRFEKAVDKLGISLNQNQFDALVSFAFNCGEGSLRKLVNGRNLPQIADALLLYNKAGGKVLAGLTRRRQAERKLFLSPAKVYDNAVDVKRFQTLLNDSYGMSLKVDGNAGKQTLKAAVMALQMELNEDGFELAVDGVAGKLTLNALSSAKLSRGDRGNMVALLQGLLASHGYDCGGIDDRFGSKTEAAVRNVQADHGIEDTGKVYRETWRALTA